MRLVTLHKVNLGRIHHALAHHALVLSPYWRIVVRGIVQGKRSVKPADAGAPESEIAAAKTGLFKGNVGSLEGECLCNDFLLDPRLSRLVNERALSVGIMSSWSI